MRQFVFSKFLFASEVTLQSQRDYHKHVTDTNTLYSDQIELRESEGVGSIQFLADLKIIKFEIAVQKKHTYKIKGVLFQRILDAKRISGSVIPTDGTRHPAFRSINAVITLPIAMTVQMNATAVNLNPDFSVTRIKFLYFQLDVLAQARRISSLALTNNSVFLLVRSATDSMTVVISQMKKNAVRCLFLPIREEIMNKNFQG